MEPAAALTTAAASGSFGAESQDGCLGGDTLCRVRRGAFDLVERVGNAPGELFALRLKHGQVGEHIGKHRSVLAAFCGDIAIQPDRRFLEQCAGGRDVLLDDLVELLIKGKPLADVVEIGFDLALAIRSELSSTTYRYDSSTRRSALPIVVPKPRSNGWA